MMRFPSSLDINPLDLPATSRVTDVCSGDSNTDSCASLYGGQATLAYLVLIYARVMCLLSQTQPQVFTVMEI